MIWARRWIHTTLYWVVQKNPACLNFPSLLLPTDQGSLPIRPSRTSLTELSMTFFTQPCREKYAPGGAWCISFSAIPAYLFLQEPSIWLIHIRRWSKGLYVVARIFYLLSLNSSAMTLSGSCLAKHTSPSVLPCICEHDRPLPMQLVPSKWRHGGENKETKLQPKLQTRVP